MHPALGCAVFMARLLLFLGLTGLRLWLLVADLVRPLAARRLFLTRR